MDTGFYDTLTQTLLSIQGNCTDQDSEVLLAPDEEQLAMEDYDILRVRSPKREDSTNENDKPMTRLGASIVPGPHDYVRVAVRRQQGRTVTELASRLVESLPQIALSVGFSSEGSQLSYCETACWSEAHDVAWQRWRGSNARKSSMQRLVA